MDFNNNGLQNIINIDDIRNNITDLTNRMAVSDDVIKRNRCDLDKINKRLEVIDDEIMKLNKEYANIKAIGIFVVIILIAILIMLGLALFLKF